MADIDDPMVVKFCNEELRPMATRLSHLYYDLKQMRDLYSVSDMKRKLEENLEGEVTDGARADGRNVLTGADILSFISRVDEFSAFLEMNTNEKLKSVLKISVNVNRR